MLSFMEIAEPNRFSFLTVVNITNNQSFHVFSHDFALVFSAELLCSDSRIVYIIQTADTQENSSQISAVLSFVFQLGQPAAQHVNGLL